MYSYPLQQLLTVYAIGRDKTKQKHILRIGPGVVERARRCAPAWTHEPPALPGDSDSGSAEWLRLAAPLCGGVSFRIAE